MIMSQSDFSNWCEFYKMNHPDETYMEVLVKACDTFEIEYETVKPLLSEPLIKKIESEANRNNLLKVKSKSYSLSEFT